MRVSHVYYMMHFAKVSQQSFVAAFGGREGKETGELPVPQDRVPQTRQRAAALCYLSPRPGFSCFHSGD